MSQKISISFPEKRPFAGAIKMGGSKSEANRLLILNAFYDNVLTLENLSNSNDSDLMMAALASQEEEIDIHHAGTAMRFLTAFFACKEGREVLLTGSSRMKERPIAVLVDALCALGSSIEYTENAGFPPLKIKGKQLEGGEINVSASTSSQYLTALLLMAPKMKQGLKLNLEGKITSKPYLEMTVSLLRSVGVIVEWQGNKIKVSPKDSIESQTVRVESDWSSASYHYSLVALGGGEIKLSNYKKESLQGDKALVDIYKRYFGIETYFLGHEIILRKEREPFEGFVELNLNHCPDIAQTIACTCVGLKKKAEFTGLETLRIKETDRLFALKEELKPFGADVEITDSTLSILGFAAGDEKIVVSTYNDHRMAMSFAPLAIFNPISIENPEVVSKSYPDFWDHLEGLGATLEALND